MHGSVACLSDWLYGDFLKLFLSGKGCQFQPRTGLHKYADLAGHIFCHLFCHQSPLHSFS